MSGLDTWMPFYVGDYIADTNHLTTTEHGAYMLLLMHYWRQGPLPNDEVVLRNITRLDRRDWRRVSSVIRQFFMVKKDGLLHQKRMDHERKKTVKVSAVRKVAAANSHKARKRSATPAVEPQEGGANGVAEGAQNAAKRGADAVQLQPRLQTHARVAVQSQSHSFFQKESKQPPLRSGPPSGPDARPRSIRETVMQEGGVIVQALTGLTGRKAHGFVAHLVKLAGDDCSRVMCGLRQAEQERPVDPQTWLIAAVKAKRLRPSDRMRRDWSLPSHGDAAE